MGVCRKRSTTSVPAALSISYLIGSPPIGTSMMTLTSSGGLKPILMASRRMGAPGGWWAIVAAHTRRCHDTPARHRDMRPRHRLKSARALDIEIEKHRRIAPEDFLGIGGGEI